MKMSLSVRVYGVALLNLLFLLAVMIGIAHFEFHVAFGSLLFAPAQDRVVATARELALDLEQTPMDSRTALMGRYHASFGADFYLFDNEGVQLAGRSVTLPSEVAAALVRRGPPPQGEDGPPPSRRDPPPPVREGGRRPPRPPDGRIDIFQLQAAGLYWVGARIPIPSPYEDRPIRGTVVMAAPSFYGTPLFFDFKPWLLALGAAVASFFLCWLPFIRGLTRTVARITRATEQIAEGEFDHHLPDDRGDELGQLSVAINRMADRLSGFVGGQKRFLGDIAHELCAPIARMQFGLGILERRATEDQQAAVEDVQDEMRQMSSLVNELLSFSKAGMRSDAHPPVRVDVAQTVREAVERESGTGIGDHRAEVRVEVEEPLAALADHEYLLRAISNLIRNAIRYAGSAGPITVSGRRESGDVVVVVADSGAGIPEEEIDRVFTPFYRLETSRNRQTGGVGLGLAIVRSCVDACHGRVLCRNRKPTGLEVEIRLATATP
jgi:two-component system sensor histidine kinase CpxA